MKVFRQPKQETLFVIGTFGHKYYSETFVKRTPIKRRTHFIKRTLCLVHKSASYSYFFSYFLSYITTSTVKLPLPTDDIMDLLNLCLTSTYFQYNGKHYKQLHGTAMGSPASVVVAEIAMQNIEEQALSTYTKTLPLWLRYVDDTFTVVHKDEIDSFQQHLNGQNPHIQFTKEIEENGKIPFLDCLVSRDENKLRTTIYRKPTPLTDYSTNHLTTLLLTKPRPYKL